MSDSQFFYRSFDPLHKLFISENWNCETNTDTKLQYTINNCDRVAEFRIENIESEKFLLYRYRFDVKATYMHPNTKKQFSCADTAAKVYGNFIWIHIVCNVDTHVKIELTVYKHIIC